jgi:hypothetical protein
MLMIFLPPERIYAAPNAPEGAPERSSMPEHIGIIKLESLLVKSLDERENPRVARAGWLATPPL